jgi:hypothetical protein
VALDLRLGHDAPQDVRLSTGVTAQQQFARGQIDCLYNALHDCCFPDRCLSIVDGGYQSFRALGNGAIAKEAPAWWRKHPACRIEAQITCANGTKCVKLS